MGIVLSILLGLTVGRAMGWNPAQGIVVGAVISVASTMVLTRLLMDRRELQTEHGRVMVAITLVEDLAVVVMTVLIPNLGSFDVSRLVMIAQKMGIAILILVPTISVAYKGVPLLMTKVAKTHSQELFFVVVLAICMGTAALTQAVGLSLALGAFMAGLIIGSSDYAHETLSQLFPLRDAFVALFFVTVGLLLDPKTLFANVPLLGVMIGLVIIGKLAVWSLVVNLRLPNLDGRAGCNRIDSNRRVFIHSRPNCPQHRHRWQGHLQCYSRCVPDQHSVQCSLGSLRPGMGGPVTPSPGGPPAGSIYPAG